MLRLIVVVAIIVVAAMAQATYAQGQSKCDTICANEPSCSSGKCILTQCTDSNACFKYCLNCNGVETCYASGQSCERAYNVVVLGSSSVKCSLMFTLAAVAIFTFLFYSSK